MNNLLVLELSSGTKSGVTVFRLVFEKQKDLALNLGIVENNKKIIAAAESLREVLKQKEPKSFEFLRKQIQEEGNVEQKEQIKEELNVKYNNWWNSSEIQSFLKEENPIQLTRVSKLPGFWETAKFDTDQVELLLLFTNIGEQEEKEEKKGGKGDRKNKNN